MQTQKFNKLNEEVIELVKNNAVGVIPTDTIYGIIGSALSPRVVERIYEIKERDRDKPMIVLIASEHDLRSYFDIDLPEKFKNIWPGKVSLIVECDKFPHIHRGGNSIAFRIPDDSNLINFLKEVGPIVAPSANIQGRDPALNIKKAEDYFGNEVDFYVDAGVKKSKPSTLIRLKNNEVEILRDGAVNLKSFQ